MDNPNGTVNGTLSPDPTVPGGSPVDGLTIRQAAAVLGVSDKAVRERIKRGTLTAWKVKGKHGEQYRVQVDGTPTVPRGVGDNGTATVEGDGILSGTPIPAAWEAERAALLDQVAWLRGQVETVQAHASELARMLEQEQHNQRALEAKLVRALPAPEPYETVDPVKRPDIPTGTSEQDAPAEPEPVDNTVSTPRPWWRFW